METKVALGDNTIEALQDLIEVSIDSTKGLRDAASSVDHTAIATLLQKIANSRDSHTTELKHYVRLNQEKPVEDGSTLGKAHRKWLELRAAINSGDPEVVLIEVERGEDVIKQKYEDLLIETAGSAMNDVLQRQFRDIKLQHDLVCDLREATQAA